MGLLHHVIEGRGGPPIVFVHGFGCALSDWAAQITHFAREHQTVAVDLPGHGDSPGSAADCSIERYGAGVAELMRELRLPPAVLVGHSMGCRVVTEAALQAPEHTAAVIQVDGSQFAPAMGAVLRQRFAEPDGFARVVSGLFADMFTPKSDPDIAAAVAARALRLDRTVGEKMLTDLQRYDIGRLTASLACLRVPVMALQSTWSNDKRERCSLAPGQMTTYLETVRAAIPAVRIEIIPETGHFPQLDEPERTNAAIGRFIRSLG